MPDESTQNANEDVKASGSTVESTKNTNEDVKVSKSTEEQLGSDKRLDPKSPPADFWQIVERLSKIVSLVGVPLFLAVFTFWGNTRIQRITTGREFVQLSVNILQTNDEDTASKELKKWAVDIINHYAPVKIGEALSNEIVEQGSSFPSDQSAIDECDFGTLFYSPDARVATIFPVVGLSLEQLDSESTPGLMYDSITCQYTLMFSRDVDSQFSSITIQLSAFLIMTENSRANIRLQVGDYIEEIELTEDSLLDREFTTGEYLGDFYHEAEIPIDLVVDDNETISFPVNLTMTAERDGEKDYILFDMDEIELIINETQTDNP